MKQVEYYKNGNRTLRIKYEGIKKLLEKQNKEIERLNNIIESFEEELEYTIPIVEHNKTITKHLKEIERLNNIIDKAIEYMNDTIDFSWKDNSPIKNGKSLSLNKLLDILKGSE